MKNLFLILVSIIILVTLSNCNMPGLSKNTHDSQLVLTNAAQTVIVRLTQLATLGSSPTPVPGIQTQPALITKAVTTPSSATTIPTQVPAQPTPVPCNWAKFIDDITIFDDEKITAGTAFEKTWRIKNIGTCSWNPNYLLIFSNGDKMGAPDSTTFTTQSIEPGQSVNISVKLKAPESPGSYRGDFLLKSSDGVIFGIGDSAANTFFVKISVIAPSSTPQPSITLTPTPTNSPEPMPDITITDLSITPSSPVQGKQVAINLTILNQGNQNAESFKVRWWANEQEINPACSWTVNSLNINTALALQCDYAGYAAAQNGVVTKVFVDSDNVIVEKNEDNNVIRRNIDVVP